MAILDDVKALLSIEDDEQDNLLAVIQRLTESHYKAYANRKSIPTEHDFIIVEVMVKRFNRLGDEGMKSKSIEGLSMSFDTGDFDLYAGIINRDTKSIVGVKFL